MADALFHICLSSKKSFFMNHKIRTNLPMRVMAVLLSLVAGWQLALAQTNYSGVVTDETGEPLIGASVIIEGSNKGTMTDLDGKFSIAAQTGDILFVSYVGYIPQRITLSETASLDIRLVTDKQMLDELVVVGYGTMKKRDLTGSVASVSGKDLKESGHNSTWGALRGAQAGVSVTPNSSKPAAGYSVEIRGQNTIGKTSSPLMVVDGVVGADINAINPADIERMDILKDVSATAIYGSRGANGVIIVTTKSGKSGKTTVTYDGSVGFTSAVHLPEMFNGDEYVAYAQEAIRGGSNHNPFVGYEKENADNRNYFDWLDYTLRKGFITNHTVSLTGGTDTFRNMMSIGYTEQSGNVRGEKFRRYNAKASVEGNIDRFTLGLNMYGRFSDIDNGSKEALRSSFRLRPITQPKDAEGNEQFYVQEYRPERFTNPSFDSDNENTNYRQLSLYTTAFLDFKILDGFNFRSSLSSSFYKGRTGYSAGTFTKTNKGTQLPKAELTNDFNLSYTWDNTLNFIRNFGENHSLNAMLGTSYYHYEGESSYIAVKNLPYDFKWYNLAAGEETSRSSGESSETLISFMARLNYSFKDRYLLTLTGRYDGSSKLAEGHKWAFFPSAALAWRISQEDFMKDFTNVNELKVRVGYGESGNNAVGAYSTINGVNTTSYDFGGTEAKGQYLQRIPNYNLGWEKSKEVNLGIDFGFFNNRLGGSLELYSKKNVDIILGQNIPQTNGFSSVDAVNIGSTRNSGIEVTLNSVNIETKDFSWSTTLNFSKNKNKVLNVFGDKKDYPNMALFIGKPVQVIYDYQWNGIWQLDEAEEAAKYGRQPGEVKEVDQNNDGVIDPDNDRVILGSPFPDWTGGITNNFTYKGWDFSFYIYTRQGVFKKSGFHQNLASEYLGEINQLKVNYWTPENPSNEFYRPGFNTGNKSLLNYKDFSFVRVGHITLGYSLPEKWMKPLHMSRCRLYVTAVNPIVWTKYDGLDPEYDSSEVYDGAVSVATYQFGVNITF